MPPKKKKTKDRKGNVVPWNQSRARDLLQLDIKEGRIHSTTPCVTAHKSRAEYLLYGEAAFQGYLTTLIEAFEAKNRRAIRDDEAVKQFRQLYPKKATNHRGEPQWVGSTAELKMKQAMDNNQHKTSKPKELRASDAEYEKFQPKTFRNHIYQEVRARKFQNWVKDTEAQKRDNTLGTNSGAN